MYQRNSTAQTQFISSGGVHHSDRTGEQGRKMRHAGRSQGVVEAGTAKGCSLPPEVAAATGR